MFQVLEVFKFSRYYRRIVHEFSTVAVPLTRLTQKSVRFPWSEDCERAFHPFNEKLASVPILAFPAGEGRFVLDIDASFYGIGAVLSQVQGGEKRVITYASKTQ